MNILSLIVNMFSPILWATQCLLYSNSLNSYQHFGISHTGKRREELTTRILTCCSIWLLCLFFHECQCEGLSVCISPGEYLVYTITHGGTKIFLALITPQVLLICLWRRNNITCLRRTTVSC